MRYLKSYSLFESRVNDLDKVKTQFISFLNGSMKSHWLKRNDLTYACYQAFCKTYGYKFDDKFLDKHNGIFNEDTLVKWFKEWKEMELIKLGKSGKKYANMKFPYNEKNITK